MKLAILGCCPDTIALANAAAGDERFELVGLFAPNAAPAESLGQLPPGLRRSDDWERFVTGSEADALIVAGRQADGRLSPSESDAQLKRIAQEGLPTLVVHPACDAIVAYELDMIRRDTGWILLPYVPSIGHPALEELWGWTSGTVESPVGTIERITVERTPASDRSGPVTDDFIRDMSLVRRIVGEIEKVSGLGNADPAAGPLTLSVNLTSHSGCLVRWSVVGSRDQACSKFVLGGSRGTATLVVDDGSGVWRVARTDEDELHAVEPAWDGPRAALDRLEQAVEGREVEPTWTDACRDLEIADSLSGSLRRGRTIQLYHEEHTEEGSFMGIMAVGGCALLLLGLLLLVVFSVVEGFRMPRGRVAGGDTAAIEAAEQSPGDSRLPLVWRLWPVYPFAAFLLLQLLRMVFRGERKRGEVERTADRGTPPEGASYPPQRD